MKTVIANKRQLIRICAGLVAMSAPAVISRSALAAEDGQNAGGKLGDIVTAAGKEVNPPEDLMREHGVLDRVLLIYEAALAKYSSNSDFDPAVVTQAAQVIRDFINDYHEKSEEEQIFPRFKAKGMMTDLVDTLLTQHQAGRRVTETILQYAPNSRLYADDRRQVIVSMQAFIRMYRPHAAREDTELFPKLRNIVSAHEFDSIAEDFEKKERQLFGEDGFGKMVQRVASIETSIGIYQLAQFTPSTGTETTGTGNH